MKKILYIIFAVALCLSALSLYKVSNTPTEQIKIDNTSSENCVCDSVCICPENESDCDCKKTKSKCSCKQENGKVITVETIETNNDDIEEINPEETSDEGETFINE